MVVYESRHRLTDLGTFATPKTVTVWEIGPTFIYVRTSYAFPVALKTPNGSWSAHSYRPMAGDASVKA